MAGLNISITASNNATSAFSQLSSSARTCFSRMNTEIQRLNATSARIRTSMMTNIQTPLRNCGTAVQTFADKLKDGVDKADKGMTLLGESIKKVGTSMTKFITLPLVGLGTLSVKNATDAEEMINKFSVVFGKSTDDVKKWSYEYARSVNRAGGDIMSFLADIQDLLVGFGATKEEGAALSKEMLKLGMDLASFKNLSDAEAIEALTGALLGQTQRAKTLGKVLNENNYAIAMENMGLKGKFQNLTELEKLQVRYTSMLLQSTHALGDAKNTHESFINELKGLKGAIAEMTTNFGEIVLPMLTDFIRKIKEIIYWFADLSKPAKIVVMVLATLLAVLGPLLVIVGTLTVKITLLITIFGGFGAAMVAIMPPVLAVVAVITALALLAPLIIKHWDKIKGFFVEMFELMVYKVKLFIDIFTRISVLVYDSIVAPFRMAYNVVADLVNLFGGNMELKTSFYQQAYGDKPFSFKQNMNSFDVGTNYVPNDQVAMIHEGEAIIPKKYNPYAGNSSSSTGDKSINITVLLDGRQIAKASAPHLVNEIRLKTGGVR